LRLALEVVAQTVDQLQAFSKKLVLHELRSARIAYPPISPIFTDFSVSICDQSEFGV
jgi:hypothetical protein